MPGGFGARVAFFVVISEDLNSFIFLHKCTTKYQVDQMSDSRKKIVLASDKDSLVRRKEDGRFLGKEPAGRIVRAWRKGHEYFSGSEGTSLAERAHRRWQGLVDPEGAREGRLIDSIASSRPTAFPETVALFFRSLWRPHSVSVYLNCGDEDYRGYVNVSLDKEGRPSIYTLRQNLDPSSNRLLHRAVMRREILLYSGLDMMLFSMSESDPSTRIIESRCLDFRHNLDFLVAPLERGMLTAMGNDLGIPGMLFFSKEATLRLTRRFAHLINMDQRSKRDPLTGLITQGECMNTIRFLSEEYVRQREEEPERDAQNCSIIAINIDEFRDLKNVHGHEAGDRVLKMVARQAQGGYRFTDYIAEGSARVGGSSRDVVANNHNAFRGQMGDELLVIAADSNTIGGAIAAERFRRSVSLERIRSYEGHALPVISVSAGVASFEDAEQTLRTEFISADGGRMGLGGKIFAKMTREEKAKAIAEITPLLADNALCEAKKNGGNSVYLVDAKDGNGVRNLAYARYDDYKP